MCFGKSCRSTTFQSSSTCALASRLNPTPAAGQMPTTESSPNTSSKIIPRRTPAQLPTTVWRGFGSWTARSMSCSRILMADGGRLMIVSVSCCAGYDSVCGQLARPAMTAALISSGARNRENLHHVPINPARYPETGSGDGGGRTGHTCLPALRSGHSPHRSNQAQPSQAEHRRVFLSRLPDLEATADESVRLREPGRGHGARRRRADVVLLSPRCRRRLPSSAQAACLRAWPGHLEYGDRQ